MVSKTALLLAAASVPLASAHFRLLSPQWRADTLAPGRPDAYNQWTYPCAGVLSNATGVNTTEWPLNGGSIAISQSHPWTYLFATLGLQVIQGGTVSTFNVSLTEPTFYNVTGNGTLCIPKVTFPHGFSPKDGQKASVQVVSSGETGSALYNCADIVFRANATALACQSSPGVSYYKVASGPSSGSSTNSSSNGHDSGSGASTTSTGSGSTATQSTTPSKNTKAAAASVSVNSMILTPVVGLAAFFVYGIGW